MNTFFKDLKVVELANVLAGPAVGMFFAELGAEVIKIENKLTKGDITRSWKLSQENADYKTSAYYAAVNWGKQSILINYTNKKELEQVYNLIKEADIVIANFKYTDKDKFGLDYESVKKLNPTVIYAHISGFGEYDTRTAYDLVLQAETGFMHINGTPEVSPLKLPVAFIDILAAHQLKEGVLVALIKRMKTAKGSKVTVSLYDAAIASLVNQASNWLTAQHNPQPIGSLHPNIAPYGEVFTTKDNKKIVLAIGSNKQFVNLCNCLGMNCIADDTKFSENRKRIENRKELQAIIECKIKLVESSNLMVQFLTYQIPAGLIKSIKDVFDDPSNQSHILEYKQDNESLKSVKTTIFNISD